MEFRYLPERLGLVDRLGVSGPEALVGDGAEIHPKWADSGASHLAPPKSMNLE
jgi:hypothetical protein